MGIGTRTELSRAWGETGHRTPKTHHQGNSNTPQGEERNSTRGTQNPHQGSKPEPQPPFRRQIPLFPPPRSAVPTAKSAPRGLFISSYRLSRSGLPTFGRPLPTFPSPPTGSFGRIIRPPIRPISEFLPRRVRSRPGFASPMRIFGIITADDACLSR